MSVGMSIHTIGVSISMTVHTINTVCMSVGMSIGMSVGMSIHTKYLDRWRGNELYWHHWLFGGLFLCLIIIIITFFVSIRLLSFCRKHNVAHTRNCGSVINSVGIPDVKIGRGNNISINLYRDAIGCCFFILQLLKSSLILMRKNFDKLFSRNWPIVQNFLANFRSSSSYKLRDGFLKES